MRVLWFTLILIIAVGITKIITDNAGVRDNHIKIGVNPGEGADIMKKVREIAARSDLDIEIIEFSDFMTPNIALDHGDIDANIFQHQPYLSNQIEAGNYKIEAVATTIVTPMKVYSNKIKNITDLPDGALISMPSDTTNFERALLLLEKCNIIQLKKKNAIKSVYDIESNPKNIKFVEVDAAQVPRTLQDVHAAVINTNYAVLAKISPDIALCSESAINNRYANLIVVQSKNKDKKWVKTLVESYRNAEVKQYIQNLFPKDSSFIIPTW
ncbi:MAG: metal ABC transporter substrate-binding protein [Candidatus Liberibacter europaeus]|uniref:Lipoprotein n=1 Tax=Candidatus Liberibacter europaeus TaxID=744859 RepID=A0A2T4VYK5_9HYPH|nr:metal ABC transporter substrate-binding protein [Candidatus Liberibacter europaeus]PTL86841.1 MAG: metal ABC transporter substrate-binding protein [Candidatus Liberibacter europaeus]